MQQTLKLLFSLFFLINITFANNSTSINLIKNKCASCHVLDIPNPTKLATLTAPPMNAVMYHVKSEIKDPTKQEAFISLYSLKPLPKNAVCKSTKVEKFGVMPSMEGKVTEEELKNISHYLVKNFPSKKFTEMMKEVKLYQEINELRHSTFLVNQKGLPKLTKLLMENWGKGKLSLSSTQKTKLLDIRHEIISVVMAIKDEVAELESEIIEMTVDGDDIENIEVKVYEVAKLKAKATVTQIKCLKNTLEVLNDKQLFTLLPMWGM
jgi:hypothetical protein